MRWIAPAAKDVATADLEKRLWAGADALRANSGLTSAQYSQPVLGLIFLRFADARFAARRAQLAKAPAGRRGSRGDDPAAYHESGVLFLPAEARPRDLARLHREGGFVRVRRRSICRGSTSRRWPRVSSPRRRRTWISNV